VQRPLAWIALALAGIGCGGSSGSPAAPHDASAGDSETAAPADGGDATAPQDGLAPGPDAGGASDAGDATANSGPLVAYASGYSATIDLFAVEAGTGALSLRSSIASFGSSPSFLAINRAATHLYAVDENASGRVGAYAIDPTTGALTFQNAVSSGGNGPPFVALDRSEAFVMVANYGDGTVTVLRVQPDGSLGSPVTTIGLCSNPHMILLDPSNRFAFVPCLGSDLVAQFQFDVATGHLLPNAPANVPTAAGAGPRHMAFHPNGKWAYLINETNSTMTAFELDTTAGTLAETQTISTLPPGFTGTNTAAEVWVHPSGAWVLGSNRGADDLVVFAVTPSTGALTVVGFTPSGGMTPRDFTFDPTGTLVYAANQGTGKIVPFRFDATTGTLTATATAVDLDAASFVGVTRLP
jgi:6-phosphogluconolactonase